MTNLQALHALSAFLSLFIKNWRLYLLVFSLLSSCFSSWENSLLFFSFCLFFRLVLRALWRSLVSFLACRSGLLGSLGLRLWGALTHADAVWHSLSSSLFLQALFFGVEHGSRLGAGCACLLLVCAWDYRIIFYFFLRVIWFLEFASPGFFGPFLCDLFIRLRRYRVLPVLSLVSVLFLLASFLLGVAFPAWLRLSWLLIFSLDGFLRLLVSRDFEESYDHAAELYQHYDLRSEELAEELARYVYVDGCCVPTGVAARAHLVQWIIDLGWNSVWLLYGRCAFGVMHFRHRYVDKDVSSLERLEAKLSAGLLWDWEAPGFHKENWENKSAGAYHYLRSQFDVRSHVVWFWWVWDRKNPKPWWADL